MVTLVTGATGFVGSAVLRRLAAAGHATRCLVRPASDRSLLAGIDTEVVVGDLTDPDSLRAAARGARWIFHVAAEYRLWHPRPAELLAANVDGTRNVLRAALDAGVDRVVYTSSVATLGLNADDTPADEDTPVALGDMIGVYKRSKFLAEAAALELFEREGLPVVIVNPSAPIGPRDVKPTPTGRMILDAAAGRMPAYVDTGLNVAHVDDVADGHLAALERGEPGRRYVLGGRNRSLRDILTEVAELVGRRPPRVRLAPGLILPLAHAAEAWARVSGGGEPRITVDGVRLSRKKMYYTDARARRELGYEPARTDAALRDAVRWFEERGSLSRRAARREVPPGRDRTEAEEGRSRPSPHPPTHP